MVNIQDVNGVVFEVEDMLKWIFDQQRRLLDKYRDIENSVLGFELFPAELPVDLDTHAGQFLLKAAAYRVVEELSEATNCLKNKPWKQTQVVTDRDHFEEEVADAFHFFVEFCILAGIDEERLFDLYARKHKVNVFRQESKY